ncbi:hypothetical protein J6Z19_01235 [bacterium]|nr:hypothetical protein [bacterium]
MRKFFILTLMVASLMMVSCVERRNQVILDKFIPVDDSCEIKVGGDKYYTEGVMDLAFTDDYKLAFQITNRIPSSDGGGTDLATSNANYFYVRKAEIKYEWDPNTQQNGNTIRCDKIDDESTKCMNRKLWDKKTREMSQDIVVDPDGGQAAGYIHLFERAQIENLLGVYLAVPDFDWIASPLQITVRIIGYLSDGTEVKTNRLYFSIIPTFGTTVQMGSVYPYPADKCDDIESYECQKALYDVTTKSCAYNDPVMNGCYYGQDYSSVNCYAGDTEWERYIADTYGESNYTGYAAADVVEMIYNQYKKVPKDKDEDVYFKCCPGKAMEEPEKPEEDENGATTTAPESGE